MTIDTNRPSIKDLRIFGTMFAFIFGVPFTLFFHKYLFICGILFLYLALKHPISLTVPYRYWMKFSLKIGEFNTKILLFIIYLLWFTPMAIFFKIIDRDYLKLRFSKKGESYWVKSEIVSVRERLERLF